MGAYQDILGRLHQWMAIMIMLEVLEIHPHPLNHLEMNIDDRMNLTEVITSSSNNNNNDDLDIF